MPSAKTGLRPPTATVEKPQLDTKVANPVPAGFDESNTVTVPWYRTTLAVGLIGSVLVWASLPPVGWSWLAWMAPLPWLWLILQPALPGRRANPSLLIAGFAFWMGTLHWLRLPHWATNIGWIAMSAYLALYVWAFVALSRVAVHRLKATIVLAAPIVWTGLEVVRGYLLGGFTIASLAHTQYQWLEFVQLADVIGCYGISGLMMLVTASVARVIPWAGQKKTFWPLGVIVATLGIAIAYGRPHVNERHGFQGPTVALIQGTFDTTFDYDPDENRRVMGEYVRLTTAAVEELRRRSASTFDLIVWPESMFRSPLVSFSDDYREPEGADWTKEEIKDRVRQEFTGLAQLTGTPALVGLGREHLTNDRQDRWNSAIFVGQDGKILSVYDKQHLVMFGEYIPLFDLWPALLSTDAVGRWFSARPLPSLANHQWTELLAQHLLRNGNPTLHSPPSETTSRRRRRSGCASEPHQ